MSRVCWAGSSDAGHWLAGSAVSWVSLYCEGLGCGIGFRCIVGEGDSSEKNSGRFISYTNERMTLFRCRGARREEWKVETRVLSVP